MAPSHRATFPGLGLLLSATALLYPLLIALTTLFASPVAATATAAATTTTTTTTGEANAAPTVLDISDRYKYLGCYNETTAVDGAGGVRALDGGINEVRKGDMTVQLCLGFCGNGDTQYKYAGLEYSRECWCAQRLSAVSAKLADSECNLGCDGDLQTACAKVGYGLAAIPLVTGLLFGLL